MAICTVCGVVEKMKCIIISLKPPYNAVSSTHTFKLNAAPAVNAAFMAIKKWASLQVKVPKVRPLFVWQSVMHIDNMMDEQTDGPTHFSWSAL